MSCGIAESPRRFRLTRFGEERMSPSLADGRTDANPVPTFEHIVASRRSVRAFLPDPLPRATIEHIFTVAGQAPSNCNVQPWITHVVSGQALVRIREVLMSEAAGNVVSPDVPITTDYVDRFKARRIGSAVALFEATGVDRHDVAGREQSMMRNYQLFDAPHAAFFFMPRTFGIREASDVGIYAQTLMLTLTAHGYGSCAQGSISHYAPALKRELGVSDDLLCLFGLSFGRPDERHPSTTARTDRAPLAETVVFHE
jgi:nitroreductase